MIRQLFCAHKWNTHIKAKKSLETFVPNIIGDNYNATGIVNDITIEFLICEKCGKIKKIKY